MGQNEGVIEADAAQASVTDGVAVITLTTSETGALTQGVRAALLDAIEDAAQDDAIEAIVLRGSETTFATGAGLGEAETGACPTLSEVCDRIEALDKPVIAAIAGVALGGGLELALAVHLRVSTPTARLGCPEITLGLVPSAGGTQRLPKVVGGIAALKMLLSGRAVNGQSAHKLGLIDLLATEDLIGTAIRQAKRLAASDGELRRSSTRRDRLGEGTAFLEAVAAHRRVAAKSPLDAPLRLIECVEAALLLPYDIGRGMEQAAYEDLQRSEHSHALRHVFAAERRLTAASRWEGRTPSRPLKSVGVVGFRGLGAEMVVLCLDAGFDVIVSEESDSLLEAGVTRVIEFYDARVAAGAMSEDALEATLDRMRAVAGYKTLAEADVVVDLSPRTTAERLETLDASMRAGAILIIGAEGAEISTIAARTRRASDVVGLRASPGLRKNRLVEIVGTPDTGPRAVATARALARKLDRLIIETGDAPLSIATRLAEAMHAAADLCLEDGASVSQVDAALKDWGIPFGSFAWRDIIGIGRPGMPTGQKGQRGSGLDETLVEARRFGAAVGAGYYLYPKRGVAGVEDPVVTNLVTEDRHLKGIRPGPVDDGIIRKRVISALAGAGAAMLADGTAASPGDIDMVALHGLGFARRSGGAMFPADRLGVDKVAGFLNEMSRNSARIAPPGPVINDLVRSGKSFGDLND